YVLSTVRGGTLPSPWHARVRLLHAAVLRRLRVAAARRCAGAGSRAGRGRGGAGSSGAGAAAGASAARRKPAGDTAAAAGRAANRQGGRRPQRPLAGL